MLSPAGVNILHLLLVRLFEVHTHSQGSFSFSPGLCRKDDLYKPLVDDRQLYFHADKLKDKDLQRSLKEQCHEINIILRVLKIKSYF
jgi:hypothetical protein